MGRDSRIGWIGSGMKALFAEFSIDKIMNLVDPVGEILRFSIGELTVVVCEGCAAEQAGEDVGDRLKEGRSCVF